MPGSLPVSTILFGLISAFLTIPGFHAAEPVPVPTEVSGIPFIGETSPTVSPEVPPEEGRIVFIENTALPSGQTAEPIAVPTETLSVLILTEAPAIAPTAMQAAAATEEIPAAPAEGMSLAEMKVWLRSGRRHKPLSPWSTRRSRRPFLNLSRILVCFRRRGWVLRIPA